MSRGRRSGPARLQRQYEVLRALLAKASADEIRTRHRIGEIIVEVQSQTDKYGSRSVDQLADALSCDRTTLYRAAQVARAFDRQAIAHWSQLSWSHLVVVSTVDDEAMRAELLDRAMAGLSVRELESRRDQLKQGRSATISSNGASKVADR